MAQPPTGGVAHPAADEILYHGIMKHSASLGGYTKWFLVSVVASVAAGFLGTVEFFAGWPLWIAGFVGLPGLVWTYLRHITTKYKISRQRVEFERGVLGKTVDSLELWRVLDVRYHQTFWDRIIGNARITLVATDQTDPELLLYGMPQHRELFEKLREAVQVARHTNRPMELVGQDGVLEGQ